MLQLIRTTAANPDFVQLVAQLDRYLHGINGDKDDFFTQFNKIDQLQHVVIAYQDQEAVGCGAIKEYNGQAMEVKRMFVPPLYRGKGIAPAVLISLEEWTKELGYNSCVLETSRDMPAAIRLYQKQGYQIISNYGQYQQVESSVCFEKKL